MPIRGDNPFLPPEIIINILKRLPVKSLIRFCSVCKDWKNLFKTQYFIAEHYQHSAHKNPLLIFHEFGHKPKYSPLCVLRYKMESVEVERIPVSKGSFRCFSDIIGSCNGLLCVVFNYNFDGPPSLLLLNPATKEVRQVPRTRNDCRAYDAFRWGFGFSPVVRDYKIMKIYLKDYNNGYTNLDNILVDGVEVYSLSTGSWKEVEFGVIQSVKLQSGHVAVNGAIFWLGSLLVTEDHRLMIVSFDLAMEVFTLIPLPSSTSDPRTHLRVLDMYENKLAMLHHHYAHKYASIDLWVLEQDNGAYGESWIWTKKYSIGPTPCSLKPICSWRNKIVCRSFECVSNGTLENVLATHLFNLTPDNELKKFHVFSPYVNVYEIFKYAESLVSMCDKHIE